MERDLQQPAVNKPSGIPRASKLPVLQQRPPQILGLKREDANAASSKPSNQPPRLQKRSSVASFPRPTQASKTDSSATSRPFASRGNAVSGSNHAPRSSISSTSTRASAARSSSRGNQQNMAPVPSKSSAKLEDEENYDQLSSLGSFWSASRQGFRDDSPPETESSFDALDLPPTSSERKGSRPSLSDRTIESLQNLPSTPKERRRSSFFSPIESPMGPPPRPASSMSRNGSNGSSRPGTSDGNFAKPFGRSPSPAKRAPASSKPATRSSLGGFGFTPATGSRRSVSTAFSAMRQGSEDQVPGSPSPQKKAVRSVLPNGLGVYKARAGSKTVATRPSKPRPTLADAFGPAVTRGSIGDSKTSEMVGSESSIGTPNSVKRVSSNPMNASSAALRQQIAAAKAAARKEKAKHDSPQDQSAATGESNGLAMDFHTDPFNQASRDGKHVLRTRINTARTDGKLNIAALGLKQIPDEVMEMYSSASMEASKVKWAEVVDLTRFITADNEIEKLSDAVFPDASPEDFATDELTEGNQFGGLEMLDLHGNRLQSLPLGLRRLERLTTLNLAHNKLENSALDVIAQISSLKELRLGHNALSGNLPAPLCYLQNLETLDLQANRLLGLPEALRELVSLKVLNLSGNQLTALPMDAFQGLHLIELDASSNALIASLFPLGGASAHSTLQTLKVANNSLAALTFSETLDLPQVRTLDVTNNHITTLPRVSGWKELVTLTAGDNKIAEMPLGFTALEKLRNANFTGNEIRLLDLEIGTMESLESLILASNPLREKKFLSMTAADIKRDLRARLEPAADFGSAEAEEHNGFHDTSGNIGLTSPTRSWALMGNGTLDLAGRSLSDNVNDSLGSFLKSNEVKQLHLSSNKLTAVPPALWLGQDLRILDLSGNALHGSDYLSDELDLPSLQELNLSRCSLATLDPLITQLQAPDLRTMNITANRLSGPLPTLRATYPVLTTLLAGDNKFRSVTAESLRGLHAVNLVSNDVEQLPADVGLLWDEGLRSLEVGSNVFRVPNYRLLEKGTEAVMRWLRDRIPDAGVDERVENLN